MLDIAQMGEHFPSDQKVPSLIPDPAVGGRNDLEQAMNAKLLLVNSPDEQVAPWEVVITTSV